VLHLRLVCKTDACLVDSVKVPLGIG